MFDLRELYNHQLKAFGLTKRITTSGGYHEDMVDYVLDQRCEGKEVKITTDQYGAVLIHADAKLFYSGPLDDDQHFWKLLVILRCPRAVSRARAEKIKKLL